MRVFVTGGTGLLGNTVLRQLEEAGHQTSALVRGAVDEEVFHGLKTRLVVGDLLKDDVIDSAIEQCDAVIHCAGYIHLGWAHRNESMKVNRDGARRIVDACVKHNRKLIHVGTVNALVVGARQTPASETTPASKRNEQAPCSYVTSKRAGVEEVRQGVERGLRASIVHPGFMLGPWDWKPSSGRMMVEVGRAWRPLTPRGGCSVCDSRDVAAGAISAIDRGGDDGGEFILAGHNMTYFELWDEIAKRMGTLRPLSRTGPAALWIAGAIGDLSASLRGKESDLNSAAVKMSSMYHWYDSSKAHATLGYATRPLAQTLDEAAAWTRDHHLAC